jgi:hypothetical protein
VPETSLKQVGLTIERPTKEAHMKVRLTLLVALATVVTLTAVAAAGPHAAKQRVAIETKILPGGTFVLTPLQAGALKRDSGSFSGNWSTAPGRDVVRHGQSVGIYTNTWTLTGKRGTFTIRERVEWVNIGTDGNGDGEGDSVATGTWKVVRGTGQYAGVTGSGGSGHAGLGLPWNARFEGFLTTS